MTEDNKNAPRAYCFKCKTKRDMLNAEAIYNRAGIPATRGICRECGTTMYLAGRTAAHEGLPKPEKVERPSQEEKEVQTESASEIQGAVRVERPARQCWKARHCRVAGQSPQHRRILGRGLHGYVVAGSCA